MTAIPRSAAVLVLVLAGCSRGGLPEPENLCEAPGARCVSAPARDVVAVDGDTFELQRLTQSGLERIRLRLIGWDSPETSPAAACPGEHDLGRQVEDRARDLFAGGRTLSFLADGADQYGRIRAHVYLDGRHVGWLLARDGLAEPWDGTGPRPDWCAR